MIADIPETMWRWVKNIIFLIVVLFLLKLIVPYLHIDHHFHKLREKVPALSVVIDYVVPPPAEPALGEIK
ncbi:hypothetical protein HOD08_04540 [bacterium]|jgi:hypothetical protein|nr:hypothetical protein [bacterium]